MLIIASTDEPTSLNPLFLQGPAATTVGALGYSYLTKYDARGEVVADAATFVPTLRNGGISPDGKRIVYHLRRDIKWQDGYPLTARDVVFTYRAIMNPSNAIPSRGGYDHVKSIRARDRYTVGVELTQPQAPFVTSFFGGDSNYPILPAHLLAVYPNLNHVAFNALPLGSGPYRFTKWLHGDRLDLTANDHYYGTKPAIHHLSIRFVHDASTIISQLMSREIDATFFASAHRIAVLRSIPNHRVVVTRLPYFMAVVFNTSDPVVHDVVLRRALVAAIDRHALVAKGMSGLYDADAAMRGLFTWAFDPHAGTIAYEPRRARVLLSADGWIPGIDGIRVKEGRRLEVQLIFPAQFSAAPAVVPMLIEQERAVGVDLTVKAVDVKEMFSLNGPLYQGGFQVALAGYQNGVDPDPSYMLSCDQRAPKGFNWARYCNETTDRALQAGLAVYDRADRSRIYAPIQRRLLVDVPYHFLWQISEIDVLPSALRGYEPSAVSPYNSVAHWWLQQ